MSSLSGTHHEPADLAADALDAEPMTGPGERGLRPDVALLERAKTGDRAAYGQIVVLYQDRLYNAVLRVVGDRDEAMELTQEAFTRGLDEAGELPRRFFAVHLAVPHRGQPGD